MMEQLLNDLGDTRVVRSADEKKIHKKCKKNDKNIDVSRSAKSVQ